MKRISLLLDDTDLAKLKRLAEKNDRSVSAQARVMIKDA